MAAPAETISQTVEIVSQNWEWAILLSGLVVGALSHKQRLAVRDERDKNQCQAPFRHKCNGWGMSKELNVHHILPQRWASKHMGMTEDAYDVPENVLTICTHAHDMIHPDNQALRAGFRRGEANPALTHRDQLVESGIPYWFQGWDKAMLDKAKFLTLKAMREKKWTFPPKNGNGNGHH